MDKATAKTSRFSTKSIEGRSSIFKPSVSIQRKMKKLDEEDERDSIILAVRDQVIELALDKCYEKYLENQSVKFVVHCAHLSLLKLLNIRFFAHEPGRPYYEGHPDWECDVPPETSGSDTWAANTMEVIPVKGKEEKGGKDSILSSDVEEESEESADSEFIESSAGSEVSVESETQSDLTDMPKFQEMKLEEEQLSVGSTLSTTSIFTRTKFISFSQLPQQLLPNNSKMREFTLQDMAVPLFNLKASPRLSPMQLSLDKLPPIRALTKFKQNEKDEAKKSKNKKSDMK